MEAHEIKVVEAILFVADEPVPAGMISEVLERPTMEVEAALRDLAASYEAADRGFVLRNVAGGWRLYSHPDCAPWLERFVARDSRARMSAASLEVLAIVAYKQPIARSQISEIRGVESDRVVRGLLQRELIEEAGHQSSPGGPALLRVTPTFLEKMGLASLDDLPPLVDFMPDSEAVEDMEAKLSPDV